MTAGQAYAVARFFRVVPPVPGLLMAGFAAVALVGVAVVLHAPSLVGRVFATLLLLQMFAASSGFMVPARRGHYDLLLTRRSGRVAVAMVHWGASVVPGVLAWLALGVVELIGRGGGRADLLASGTCCAMAVVSMLSWATGVALPRFGGAIVWLVLMVAAGKGPAHHSDWRVAAPVVPQIRDSAAAFLIDPSATSGVTLTGTEWLAVTPGLLIALVAMIVAVLQIVRGDVALEAGQ